MITTFKNYNEKHNDKTEIEETDDELIGTGTAFPITHHHILTAYHNIHLAKNVEDIKLYLPGIDGYTSVTKFVFKDDRLDMAILEVDDYILTPFVLAKHFDLEVGDNCMLRGYYLPESTGRQCKLVKAYVSSDESFCSGYGLIASSGIFEGMSGSPVIAKVEDCIGYKIVGMITHCHRFNNNIGLFIKSQHIFDAIRFAEIELPLNEDYDDEFVNTVREILPYRIEVNIDDDLYDRQVALGSVRFKT